MKLKQEPDDFQVEELTDVAPGGRGPFGFYRLEKVGWSTPDALAAIRRRWQIGPERLSYGGLKDRHASTVQFLTIHRGPRRRLTHQRVTLSYLGQVERPYTSTDIRANRFRICLRDLSPSEVNFADLALQEVRADGVPNYFDDQRFGSVSPGGEFIARQLVLGRFEEALKLALAGPYEYDRAPQKREKAILHEHWGDWALCKKRLPRGHARSLADYLVHHPGDYRGAVARLRPELRGLYLSAYQSDLWNRMLAAWLRERLPAEQIIHVDLRLGPMPMHRCLDGEQRRALETLMLPLPSARMRFEPDDARATLVQSVLAEEGIQVEQMKIKGVRELFFSKGERAGLCLPSGLEWDLAPDDRHTGREKLNLAFELPRGSYATLIVKRVTLSALTCRSETGG
jgi:tRNA pseudouridine13 synthase